MLPLGAQAAASTGPVPARPGGMSAAVAILAGHDRPARLALPGGGRRRGRAGARAGRSVGGGRAVRGDDPRAALAALPGRGGRPVTGQKP